MPLPIARMIAESTDQQVVVLGRQLYAIRRVNSDALRRQGWATLEGAASVQDALKQAMAARAELEATLAGKSEEEIATDRARVAALEAAYNASLVGRPEGALAYLDRLTAYICAAVVGAGGLTEEAVRAPVEILDPGCDLAEIAQDLRDPDEIAEGKPPVYLAPMRFTRVEAEEDLDRGTAWVYRLSERQRSALGEAIGAVQSVSTEVTTFRDGTRPGRPDLAPVDGNGTLAARGPGADAVADGVRPVVPSRPRSRRGRDGEGGRVPADPGGRPPKVR